MTGMIGSEGNVREMDPQTQRVLMNGYESHEGVAKEYISLKL